MFNFGYLTVEGDQKHFSQRQPPTHAFVALPVWKAPAWPDHIDYIIERIVSSQTYSALYTQSNICTLQISITIGPELCIIYALFVVFIICVLVYVARKLYAECIFCMTHWYVWHKTVWIILDKTISVDDPLIHVHIECIIMGNHDTRHTYNAHSIAQQS